MVKFTFVSVFLIVTAMSALVFAAPPTLEKYSISISGTDYFLLSNGTERAGQPVTLVTGYNPDTTVVSIRKVTRRGLTVSPVIGKAGLSVTAPEGEHYLVWDTPDTYTLPPWWGFHSRFPEPGYFIREGGPLAWVKGSNDDLVLHLGHGAIFTVQVAV